VISGDIPVLVPARAGWTATLQTESATPGAGGQLRGVVPLGDRWAMAVRGAGRSTGDVRLAPEPTFGGVLRNTFHRNLNGAVGFGYTGERVTGGVALQGYGLEHGVPLPPEEEGEIVLVGRKLAASGRLEMALGSRLFPSLRLQGSAVDYGHEELEDGEVEMAFGLRTRTVDALVRQARVGPFAEGAWGVSALLRQYVATGDEQLTAPADSRALGVFGYQELPLARGASLQLGARADRFAIASQDDPAFGAGVERSFTALSGSAGLSVRVAPGVAASLSAARSFRAPTVEELFSDAYHLGTASYEIGDPQLRPEVAQGFDAGLRMSRVGATGEISFYTKRIADFIHFEERGEMAWQGGTVPLLAYVQDGARFTGAEGRVELVAGRHWVVGFRGDHVRAALADGTPVPFLPAARLGTSLRWDDGRISAGSALRHAFAQRRVGLEGERPTDAFTLLDLEAGVRVLRGGRIHSLNLRVDNATDRLFRDAASRIKEFAPNPGRNVSVVYRLFF
jgi:iron complex outermembrane recepter protein